MSENPDAQFAMLYCDNVACRVNTFETGPRPLLGCPACGDEGLPIPERVR